MDVLVTCKYEEDLIKNEGARVLTRLYDVFVLQTCKNEEYLNKNEGAKVLTRL